MIQETISEFDWFSKKNKAYDVAKKHNEKFILHMTDKISGLLLRKFIEINEMDELKIFECDDDYEFVIDGKKCSLDFAPIVSDDSNVTFGCRFIVEGECKGYYEDNLEYEQC